MTHLETAESYLRAGLCVLPAILGQKRPAPASWREYQGRLPTEEEVRRWFAQADALCLVTGKVSGNLEMLDFDLGGEAFQPWYLAVEQADAGLLSRLVIEQSPSGGWHVVYRCRSAHLRQSQARPASPVRRRPGRGDDPGQGVQATPGSPTAVGTSS